jgi:hypothetical protein
MKLYIKLLKVFLFISFIITSFKSYALSCSWEGDVIWQESKTIPKVSPEKKVAQTATAVTTTASTVVLGLTQVAQGSRIFDTLQILSCTEKDNNVINDVSWQDSPTTLSIGNNDLSPHIGAVVGNWAIFGASALIGKGASLYWNPEKTKFPGALIIPAMFLYSSTATSSMILISQGSIGEKFVGGISMGAQVIGAGVVMIIFLPKYFHAEWNIESGGHWIDTPNNKGYVKCFGILFMDYTTNRQGFIIVELGASLATGILKSYQSTGGDCRILLTLSAITSTAYAISIIFLRPHIETKDKIFYGVVSGAQAIAVITQATATWLNSQEVRNKVRAITEPIVMATEYLLLIRSIYDIGMRLKKFYNSFYHQNTQNNILALIPEEPVLSGHVEFLNGFPLQEHVGTDSSIELELSSEYSNEIESQLSLEIDSVEGADNPIKITYGENTGEIVEAEQVPVSPEQDFVLETESTTKNEVYDEKLL